jgi:hypothetical protein
LHLAESAYAGLPRYRLQLHGAHFRITLRLTDGDSPHARQPPLLTTTSGPDGLICGIMNAANFVVLCPHERTGLVVVSRDTLHHPYHVRYELIEFAVFVLASRAQGLVPLHAACIARSGRAVLLMGSSGAGKSTLALHCLMLGMTCVAEDAVFVEPQRLLASGVSNFLHVRRDSLKFIDDASISSRVRKSPVIVRRSGVEKFQVDLRSLHRQAGAMALRIAAIIFLSSRGGGRGAALTPLKRRELMSRLAAKQPYPARLPSWKIFSRRLTEVSAFELRRGQHPTEAAVALRLMLSRI